MTRKPFFMRFLENQPAAEAQTASPAERVRTDVKAGARTRPMVTLKWPSDSDEGGVDI